MPSDSTPFAISHIDIMGMIAMQAQIILSSAGQVAQGGAFPNPRDLQKIIDRMSLINSQMVAAYDAMQPASGAKN